MTLTLALTDEFGVSAFVRVLVLFLVRVLFLVWHVAVFGGLLRFEM